MTEERKQEIRDAARALRCTSTPCGDCMGDKCRFWQEEDMPEDLRDEVGDTWGGCDCDKVGMAGADAIDELLKEIEQLEDERMLMLIKMHGDCGVCIRKDERGGVCSECLMNEAHPHWRYEGSRAL